MEEMSLRNKLKKIRDSSDNSEIDWGKTKNDWINSVNNLFKIIKDEWFSELEDEGLLKIQMFPIYLIEEHIGKYSIDKMEITYNTGSIVFEPVGSNIIGGEGRIDLFLKGEYSKGWMLILFRENGQDNWSMIKKQNRREPKLLTKKFLEKMIEQWI